MNCRPYSTPPRRTWGWLKSGLLGAALALFGTAQAQVTVQIGTGTSTNSYQPLYTCYGYNYSQQIYTAAEITAGGGGAGDISKIRFYYNSSGTNYANWSNWTVYLVNTTQEALASNTGWIPVASMTQVFTGTIPTPVPGTWLELTLPTPFAYDGTNLVVAVDENSTSYSCTASWRSFTAAAPPSGYRALLYYSDGTNPNPASPPTASFSGTSTTVRAQIQLDITQAPCADAGTPAISGTATACAGAANMLSVTGEPSASGISREWAYGPVGGPYSNLLGTASTQSTASIPAGSWEVVVTTTCANCGPCSATSAAFPVTINALPTVMVSPTTANFCIGGSPVALTASGAANYTWLPVAGLDVATGSVVNASPTANTTYTVTGMDGEGCTNTATATVNAINAPVVNSATADPNPACFNGTSLLNATAILPSTVDQYVFASSVGTFTSIVGAPGTVQINTGADDTGYGPYPLGFTFNFNGINFTSAGVNANGYVAMGALASSSYTALSSGSLNNVIAAFNGDLYGLSANGAKMSYQLSGTPGSQVFTFEWTNWGFYSSGLNEASYQVKLYEGSNTVQIVYQNGTGTNAKNVQVGLRGSSTAVFSNRTTTTDWTATTAGGANTATCTVSATVRPVNGLTFTWTLPSLLGATYAWTPNTFLDDASLQSPTASGVNVASIGYQVTATYLGCPSSNFGAVTLTTSAPITAATITGTLEYCAGGSTTLTAVPTDGAGPYTYLWSPGGETTASIDASAPGLYNCQVTDGCGGSVNTGDVTVTELAIPTVEVSPTSALLCDGASQVLTASGADSYAWSPAAGLDMVTGPTVTATPATSTTYTVTGTAANGCTNTATAAMSVGTTPVVNNVSATPGTACYNSDVQLLASAGTPPSYCNSNFTSATFEFITNVDYAGISQTSGGNIGGPVDYTAQVASVTVGTPNNLSVTVDPDASDYVYAWIDWNQNGVLNDAGETYTLATSTSLPGPHILSITPPAGAYNGNTRMRVMIDYANAVPNPCRSATWGEAEDYTVNVSGGVEQYLYSWTPATGLDDATIPNPMALDVTVDASYTVTVSDGAGCAAASQTASFTVLGPVTTPVIAPAAATICVGGDVQLTASVPGSEPAPYCLSNFTSSTFESLANVTFDAINNTTGASVGGPVDYTAMVANVTVGTPTTLSVTAEPDASDYIYAWIDWNQNGILNDAGEAYTVAVSISTPGPFTLAITPPAGAYNGNTRMRVMMDYFNSVPNPCRSATYGEAEDYTVNVSGGDEPPPPPVYTYSWNPADFLSDAGIADPMAENVTTETTYTVTVTNQDGCPSAASTPVTVSLNPALNPVINEVTADPNPVCPGSDVQLGVSVGGALSYCNSSFSNVTYEHVTNVTYAGINNTTGGIVGGPVDYTSQVASVTVGTPNDLSVSIQVDASENVAAWIDWNQNGILGDAGETYQLATFTSSPGPFTMSVTPPAGAVNGNTRMRVQLSYSTGNAPCVSSFYGESEDYTVNVSGGIDLNTYSWTPSAGLDDATSGSPVAQGVLAITEYTVVVTDANGCPSTGSVNVTVETADGDGDGTADCADGCPTDPLKADPGQCGCFNPDTDSDGDLVADCVDLCPADPNKSDPGICGCGVSDVDTDLDGTVDCLDLCPNDPTKIVPGTCGCGVPDTDGDTDGVADCVDSCPGVFGQIGSACDDGNGQTINDVLDANCECHGTAPECEANSILLDLVTDLDGSQTSWDIVDIGTENVVCSGNGYLANQTITLACCLEDGCYELRVFDSAGDGMSNGTTGGYVLRTLEGDRIIDNSGDGVFASVSQISGHLGFCVPLGTDKVIPAHCDKDDWTLADIIQSQLNSAVTAQYGITNATSGYQFWFTNPDGGYNRRISQTHAAPGSVSGAPANQRAAYLKLSAIVSYPLPAYTNLNVRVRTQVAGVFSEWGPACRFALNPPCATTQLTTTASPVVSCGATGLLLSSRIYATAVPGANLYQFEFTKPGYLRRIEFADRSTLLNFVTYPLTNNTCYNVRVRVSFDGGNTFCPFGPYCTITIGTAVCAPAMPLAPDDAADYASESKLTIWPNPNDGSLVNISFTDIDVDVNTVGVDVMDAVGRVVTTRTLPVQDGVVRSTMSFDETLAPGLYVVNLQAGDRRWTERLVIQ